jgi:hypothetical protein
VSDRSSENQLFRGALGPGPQCPPVEELARILSANPPTEVSNHVASCAHCQTEVHLLQTFESGNVNPAEAAAVRQVTERLRSRSAEIFPRREPWWRGLFAAPWIRPAALAFAGLLLVAGVTLQFRRGGPPALQTPGDSSQDVMRSHQVTVLAPVGDVAKVPLQVQWQAVSGAVKYEIRLLEVDRTELWKAETADSFIGLPAPVQARIVPAKSLIFRVRAFDAAGRSVAESDMVRFRLLQNVYPH